MQKIVLPGNFIFCNVREQISGTFTLSQTSSWSSSIWHKGRLSLMNKLYLSKDSDYSNEDLVDPITVKNRVKLSWESWDFGICKFYTIYTPTRWLSSSILSSGFMSFLLILSVITILLLPIFRYDEIFIHSSLLYFKEDCLCRGSNYLNSFVLIIREQASGNRFIKLETESTLSFILMDLNSIEGIVELSLVNFWLNSDN